jgi:hypothetical protein
MAHVPLRRLALGRLAALATALAASALATALATALAASALATALATALAAFTTHTTLAPASAAAQTSSAWLGFRGTPRSPAVPSPAGLCARPPAGRPPDSVRTAQLLGTGASGLRRRSQACSSEARARSQSCVLAASVLLEQRDRMPAPAQACGEDGERATGQQ